MREKEGQWVNREIEVERGDRGTGTGREKGEEGKEG